MLKIGLTGGIAAGKSVVAKRLAELGAVLIDADLLARQVVEPGTPGLARVVEAFGPELLQADGSLDRAKLAAVVFADETRRQELNGIIHPLVRAEAARLMDNARQQEAERSAGGAERAACWSRTSRCWWSRAREPLSIWCWWWRRPWNSGWAGCWRTAP